jgi:acetyl-CoA carboxylase carboxyl transferase subunit alpha
MNDIKHPLDFELPIVELEKELSMLADDIAAGDTKKQDEFKKVKQKLEKLSEEIYGKLTSYQRVQLSRHFDRPLTLDFISHMLKDFVELKGDRQFRDDPAIVGGIGQLGIHKVVVVGHQRGGTTQERLKRNFGMPQPEGYRKALRLFKLAERFKLPLITLIDTQGAFPGLEAEERGQAEAIARNLAVLADLKIPVISVVIGEGGSGGALALGVSNRILMLENACYSVITPEGCASILWGSQSQQRDKPAAQEFGPVAAEALKITAGDLKELGVIDEIIPEPIGGAHRNHKDTADNLYEVLLKHLDQLNKLEKDDLVDDRYEKFRELGAFQELN